jgi:hypothetical protein
MLPVTVINISFVSLLFVFHYVVCSLSQTSNNFKHCSNFLEKWVLFLFKYNTFSSNYIEFGGCRGHHRMIVGFTTTYTICSYNHCCCEFESRSWQGVLDTTLCDWSPRNVVWWKCIVLKKEQHSFFQEIGAMFKSIACLRQGANNIMKHGKAYSIQHYVTDRRDMTEKVLKVALNTKPNHINHTLIFLIIRENRSERERDMCSCNLS